MIDVEELDDQAKQAAISLISFQELVESWKAIEKSKEPINLRVKALGDLSGGSSNLCAALAHLLYLQGESAEDQGIINLTRRWEAVTKRTNRKINARLRELTGTENLEDAIPNVKDWIGSWYLGAGSFGRASMYAQLSDTGDIVNRVVVKDCDFNQNEDTRDNWENDPSLFGQNDDGRKVPTEVLTMFDLRGKQGSEYIVKILNWRIASKRRLYRLYLEVSSSGEQATIQITNGLAVCGPSQYTLENLVTSYRSITTLKLWVD
jgi:hypothetical protein